MYACWPMDTKPAYPASKFHIVEMVRSTKKVTKGPVAATVAMKGKAARSSTSAKKKATFQSSALLTRRTRTGRADNAGARGRSARSVLTWISPPEVREAERRAPQER